ncbi:protein LBH isoform 1-T1 [Spinachia spinachia]
MSNGAESHSSVFVRRLVAQLLGLATESELRGPRRRIRRKTKSEEVERSPRLSLDPLISSLGGRCDFMSAFPPQRYRPVFVPSRDMTEVMISSTSMEDMRLSPSKDRLSFQIFPDPSDFDRCCKLKDRLPSIVVEPTEGEVESGELRWPPEEFLVSEGEEEEQNNGGIQNGQPTQDSQH